MQFWGSTGLNGNGPTTGNVLADFLLRDMGFGFSEFSTNPTGFQRWHDLELYASDSWKIRPRVTVDFGLRVPPTTTPTTRTTTSPASTPTSSTPRWATTPATG